MRVRTWILVADGARARIFEWRRKRKPLLLLHDLERPQAREHGDALYTDLPSKPDGNLPHEHESQVFARQVAEVLERERTAGRLEALTVIAAPQFLGLLRKAFSKSVTALVTSTVAKDLVGLEEPELAERLAGA